MRNVEKYAFHDIDHSPISRETHIIVRKPSAMKVRVFKTLFYVASAQKSYYIAIVTSDTDKRERDVNCVFDKGSIKSFYRALLCVLILMGLQITGLSIPETWELISIIVLVAFALLATAGYFTFREMAKRE